MTTTSHDDDGLRDGQTPVIAGAAGGLPPRDSTASAASHAGWERVTLPVGGLACGGGGALTVEHALQRTAGVRYVYVNPAMERAYIEYDSQKVSPNSLEEVIRSLGYRAGKGQSHEPQ